MDAAKRLTWVEDVRPLGHAPKTVAEFVKDGDVLATWAFGTLPQAIHAGVAKAVVPRGLLSLDGALDAGQRRKSPCVLDPANAGIAVQNHGYWASGYVTIARAFAPVDTPGAAHARARDALAAALAAARGGVRLPVGVVAIAIGLSLDEGSGDPLKAGAVYAVTSSATEGG
jgi:hypothetical protein